MKKKNSSDLERDKRLKAIKKAIKEFPNVVKRKKLAAKKKKKVLDAFEKEASVILKQIGIK